MTYLNFQSVRDLSPTLQSAPATIPLLEYASCYWGEHAKKEITENVTILALRLLNKFNEHISAQLISLRYNRKRRFGPGFYSKKGPIGFTGLHGAAFLGVVEILAAVLEMTKYDVNGRDNASCTPLIWAAVRGHEEVVKMLLERGDANPDLADDNWNQTPLMWAAKLGHEGVVKVIVERENVNPDKASPVYDPAALYLAATYGHEGVVKMLLEREDVNPNKIPIGYHCTPLSVAAMSGKDRVVKMLLEREDVNPNIADTDDGHTPLSNAAWRGHEGIVKVLLDRNDIRIDIQDHMNQTPLSLALSNRNHEIARMISERAAIKSDTADPGNQATAANPIGHLLPHQRAPMRSRGIGLRRLFSRLYR